MINKEIKPKFNIIDLLIILFVILTIAGIFWRFNLADEINFNATGDIFEIEFVTASHIQEASQEYFAPGEKFYINIDSLEIGEIIEILDIRNPADWWDTVINGVIIKTEQPGRIDVRGIMRSKGRVTPDGDVLLSGNIHAAPNKEFLAHTGMWEGYIRIVNIVKTN